MAALEKRYGEGSNRLRKGNLLPSPSSPRTLRLICRDRFNPALPCENGRAVSHSPINAPFCSVSRQENSGSTGRTFHRAGPCGENTANLARFFCPPRPNAVRSDSISERSTWGESPIASCARRSRSRFLGQSHDTADRSVPGPVAERARRCSGSRASATLTDQFNLPGFRAAASRQIWSLSVAD